MTDSFEHRDMKLAREIAERYAPHDENGYEVHLIFAGIEAGRQAERARVVEWLRSQAKYWEQRSRANAKKFGKDSLTVGVGASISASYSDHAAEIASGQHVGGEE